MAEEADHAEPRRGRRMPLASAVCQCLAASRRCQWQTSLASGTRLAQRQSKCGRGEQRPVTMSCMLPPPLENSSPNAKPDKAALDWQPPADGIGLGAVVAIIAAIGDLIVTAGIGHGRGEPPPIVVIIGCIIWVSASVGLLAIWLGLGGGPVWLRLLIVGATAALGTVVATEGRWEPEGFAVLALFVVAIALPFGVVRALGFKMGRIDVAKPDAGAGSGLRRGQFSLRQLFGWTVAAAMVASVARFVPPMAEELVVAGIWAMVGSVVFAGTAIAIFAPRRIATVALGLGALCFTVGSATGGASILLSAGRVTAGEFAAMVAATVGTVLLTGFTLLLFRRLGYRLQRGGQAASSVGATEAL